MHTAQEYFSILLDTLIAFRIDGWNRSVRKQIRQSPKFYFFDTGVLNALRGELELDIRVESFRFRKLFEMVVVLELIRLNDYFHRDYRFYYWRTNTGLEVDIILSRGADSAPIAIEIKSSKNPSAKDLHALQSFHSENKKATLICLCQTPNPYEIDKIAVLPWKDGIVKVLNITNQGLADNS